MFDIEIRFAMKGKEVSLDSLIDTIVRDVCASVREEIKWSLNKQDSDNPALSRGTVNELSRRAVSVREAARLLSISTRTIQNYVASNTILTVRVGRRVLIPMKTVNEVASRGISSRRHEKPICEQRG
jgi:excisionase family DNA binding protein